MGHYGNTYEEIYLSDLIERGFQRISFGTPAQDDLIRHVARMGLSRENRAPIARIQSYIYSWLLHDIFNGMYTEHGWDAHPIYLYSSWDIFQKC